MRNVDGISVGLTETTLVAAGNRREQLTEKTNRNISYHSPVDHPKEGERKGPL